PRSTRQPEEWAVSKGGNACGHGFSCLPLFLWFFRCDGVTFLVALITFAASTAREDRARWKVYDSRALIHTNNRRIHRRSRHHDRGCPSDVGGVAAAKPKQGQGKVP